MSHNCNLYFWPRTGIKVRVKPLGFDDLIARVRALAGALPDPRTGTNTQFSMADIALAAFSVFFTQCPSFLSFQRNMEPRAHSVDHIFTTRTRRPS